MDFSDKLRGFDDVWRRVSKQDRDPDKDKRPSRAPVLMPGKKKCPRKTRFLAR